MMKKNGSNVSCWEQGRNSDLALIFEKDAKKKAIVSFPTRPDWRRHCEAGRSRPGHQKHQMHQMALLGAISRLFSLSREGVVSSHYVVATGLVSRHRVEFCT